MEVGWYSGHYHKSDDGTWMREAYPIPVIGVKGFSFSFSFDVDGQKMNEFVKLLRLEGFYY